LWDLACLIRKYPAAEELVRNEPAEAVARVFQEGCLPETVQTAIEPTPRPVSHARDCRRNTDWHACLSRAGGGAQQPADRPESRPLQSRLYRLLPADREDRVQRCHADRLRYRPPEIGSPADE